MLGELHREHHDQQRRSIASRDEIRWALLLLAYTGARRAEVAQLWVADVAPVDGVLCMRVEPATDPAAPKHVKSSAARRVVPLHADLLELGLLAFVDAARATGRTQLFPSLTSRGGDPLSRWWQMRRERVGVSNRCQLHGLRHRFVSQLKHAGVDEPRIAQLVGHANASLTTGRYGKRYNVPRLAEAVGVVRNREALAGLFSSS
jgi:integrase